VGCVFPDHFLLPFGAVSLSAKRRKILGETIRKFRKHARMSQEKLAEKAELHPVYVGKIERGEKWISLHALIRIADALGIGVSDLVADL